MNLNQFTLPVTDIDRSVAFYRTLGLHQIVAAPPRYARFECPAGDTTFSLHRVPSVPPGEGAVVYFEYDDVDVEVARLQASGIVFEQMPTDERWLWREARLRDPDGHRLCLYHAGVNRKHPPWRLPAAEEGVLRVLGKATSINVRKVLWLCAELGITFELEEWATPERPTHDPAFLALNPNGLVPVIVDGETVLWESNTICRYLATKHGRTDLLPLEPRARAHVEQWMDWQATELNTAWRYAFMALVRRHADFGDAAAVARSVAQWNRLMRLLDAQLAATGAYVAGRAFTLADVGIGLSLNRWRMSPIERPELPALEVYRQRLAQRHGWRLHGENGVA